MSPPVPLHLIMTPIGCRLAWATAQPHGHASMSSMQLRMAPSSIGPCGTQLLQPAGPTFAQSSRWHGPRRSSPGRALARMTMWPICCKKINSAQYPRPATQAPPGFSIPVCVCSCARCRPCGARRRGPRHCQAPTPNPWAGSGTQAPLCTAYTYRVTTMCSRHFDCMVLLCNGGLPSPRRSAAALSNHPIPCCANQPGTSEYAHGVQDRTPANSAPADPQLVNPSPMRCLFQGCRSSGLPGGGQRLDQRSTCGSCTSWSRQLLSASRMRCRSYGTSLPCVCQEKRLQSHVPGTVHPTMGPRLPYVMPTMPSTTLLTPPLHRSVHLFPVH